MKLNNLEKFAIREFLLSQNIDPAAVEPDLDKIEIDGRDFSPIGFITDLKPNSNLKIFPSGKSFTGGGIRIKINDSIDTAYVMYIKDGYLDAIEGGTYGDDLWPSDITSYCLMSENS